MPVPKTLRRVAGAALLVILVTPIALAAGVLPSGAGSTATRAGAACCGEMACCVAPSAPASAASCGAGHCAAKGAPAGPAAGAISARIVAGCPGPPPALQPASGDPVMVATFADVSAPVRPASDLGSAGAVKPEPLAERPPSPPPRLA